MKARKLNVVLPERGIERTMLSTRIRIDIMSRIDVLVEKRSTTLQAIIESSLAEYLEREEKK